MLHITSGLLKGIAFEQPVGTQTRPTSQKVRQAVFNVLMRSAPLNGGAVIDLFAGSGAYGLECISHGASQVIFVEEHPLALKALKKNISTIISSLEKQGQTIPLISVINKNCLKFYAQSKIKKVGLIFCDPPYDKDWFRQILRSEIKSPKLDMNGIYLYEGSSREKLIEEFHEETDFKIHFEILDQKIYGETQLLFLRRKGIHEEAKKQIDSKGDLSWKF